MEERILRLTRKEWEDMYADANGNIPEMLMWDKMEELPNEMRKVPDEVWVGNSDPEGLKKFMKEMKDNPNAEFVKLADPPKICKVCRKEYDGRENICDICIAFSQK